MKHLITRIITTVLAAIVLAAGTAALQAAPAFALSTDAAKNAVCQGIGTAGNSASCPEDPNTSPTVAGIIKTVINILSFIVGAIAIIMIIVGGLKYVTSAGDSNSISSAKNTIIYALVGVVVVIFAQALVRYVIFRATTP